MKDKILNILIWTISLFLALPTAVFVIYVVLLIGDRIVHACPNVAVYVYCPEG